MSIERDDVTVIVRNVRGSFGIVTVGDLALFVAACKRSPGLANDTMVSITQNANGSTTMEAATRTDDRHGAVPEPEFLELNCSVDSLHGGHNWSSTGEMPYDRRCPGI